MCFSLSSVIITQVFVSSFSYFIYDYAKTFIIVLFSA